MTLTVDKTTLCWCLHILDFHPGEGACSGCGCQRFSPGAKTSAHHYRRGQPTRSRPVGKLQTGDRLLVGFPGRDEYVRSSNGGLVWEQRLGEVTSHPMMRHVQDTQLRTTVHKTGALIGVVLGKLPIPGARGAVVALYVVETDLGDLPPMYGHHSVLVLA